MLELNPTNQLDQLNVWVEFLKTVTTVAGTVIVAWFGNRVWKKRKENATIEATAPPELAEPPALTDARIKTIEAILESLAEDLDTRRQVLNAVLNAMELACWESDANGKCIFASDHLAKLVGLDKHDVLGDGWVTNLVEADKQRVFTEWDNAVKQKRLFVMKYSFLHSDDTIVKVRAVSSPILVKGKLQGFIGILEEVK